MDFGQNAYTALYAFCALRAMLFWPKCIYRAMGCFAYCAQCAFDRLRAMRFGDFGIECAYGAIYAKSRVTAGAGCAGKNLAMLCSDGSTYRLHNVEHSTFPAVARHEDDNPTFGQARKSELWPKWLQAILTEYTGLEQNGTWVFEKLPPGARPLNVKLVLKRKRGAEGEILKYKARLVVLGNEMKDVDMLSELFAPVGQQTTLKGMAATVAQFDLEWTQYDFSQAFVQSEIHGAPVYIKQGPGRPPELDENGHPYALRLVKSLYGLAFSPRLWHLKLHKWLTAYGWESSTSDPSLYRYKGMRMLLYVDDCCCIYDKKTSEKDYQKFMADLAKDFKYTGGDDVDFFLGFRITRDRKKHTVSMDQTAFIQKAVAHHGLTNAHPVDTPVVAGLQLGQVLCDPLDFTVDRTKYRERVGSLLWAARGTRPDIAFGVHMLSRAMHAPSPAHWDASTRMLAYLKATDTQGLTYQRCQGGDVLVGSVDADWLPKYGNDMCNMKSTTGFVFYLGGAAITWRSRRQSTFATSTAHSECNAAYEAGCEAVYQSCNSAKRELHTIEGWAYRELPLYTHPRRHRRQRQIR